MSLFDGTAYLLGLSVQFSMLLQKTRLFEVVGLLEEMGFNAHRNCPLAWKTNAVFRKTVRGDRSSNAETLFAEFC